MITVGVTAFQGAVEEHVAAVERALRYMGIAGRAVAIRQSLDGINALVIPGGESTTISTLMRYAHALGKTIEVIVSEPV